MTEWFLPRILELTHMAHDLEPFARDVGYAGPPFRWGERRLALRCELDAAFFRLYVLNAEDVAYFMDTFFILRRQDEKEHGSCRTRERIPEVFQQLRPMSTPE